MHAPYPLFKTSRQDYIAGVIRGFQFEYFVISWQILASHLFHHAPEKLFSEGEASK